AGQPLEWVLHLSRAAERPGSSTPQQPSAPPPRGARNGAPARTDGAVAASRVHSGTAAALPRGDPWRKNVTPRPTARPAPPSLSYELYPPRSAASADMLLRTIEELEPTRPDHVSVTYSGDEQRRD